MRVLVACEFSGVVRDAFRARGHDAMSCDLLETEAPGPHYKGDARDILEARGYDEFRGRVPWDMLIAFPPCTYLCNSGVRWLHTQEGRWGKMREAAQFFSALLDAPIERIAIENPVMHGYAKEIIGQQQTQTIQPWQFGHGEIKATCLWLKGLPPLEPTDIVEGRKARVHRASPGPDRWKERSRTLPGIAKAMADQWG